MDRNKKLKGFELLIYMYIRAGADSWTEALNFIPDRKDVMKDLRDDLPSVNRIVPDDDKEFLNYLNDLLPREKVLKKYNEMVINGS